MSAPDLRNLTNRAFRAWLAEDLANYGGMLSDEALTEIERRLPLSTFTHGTSAHCPLVQQGKAKRCPGHDA